jgi:hypothetical protein
LPSSDTEEKWDSETVYQLFVDFKKVYDSVRKEVLYTILFEFRVPMKLVRIIKMCLNETCSKVSIRKHFLDNFPTLNGLKQGDSLLPFVFIFNLVYVVWKAQEDQVRLKLNGTH